MEEELWKPIPDFEGLYEVSNLGRIKNLSTGKISCGTQSTVMGYYIFCLYKNGKQYARRVHKLVAEAFVPNPNILPIINHKDEDPGNNRADNLEWCSYTYNNNYGAANEKRSMSQGRKKEVIIYDKDGKEVARCGSVNETAEYLGVTRSYVTKALNGRAKTCKGYTVKYIGTWYKDLPEGVKQRAFEDIPKVPNKHTDIIIHRYRKQYANGFYNAAMDAIRFLESHAPELVEEAKKTLRLI